MRYGISVTMVLFAGQSLLAQQAVQQPIVGTTAVNTTVSVPDRGSTFLGGVSSAQSGRSQYGPLRSGTSSGFSRQSTSISTHVYIIDLNEMDQALLNSAPSITERVRPVPGKPVFHSIAKPEPLITDSSLQKATSFEKLARDAEQAGKLAIAKLYWQAAEKYGSKIAEKRLAELTKPSPALPAKAASRSSH